MGWKSESFPILRTCCVLELSRWDSRSSVAGSLLSKAVCSHVPPPRELYNSFLCWCASGDPASRELRAQSNFLELHENTGCQAWLHGPAWGQALQQQLLSHKTQSIAMSSRPRAGPLYRHGPRLGFQRNTLLLGETEGGEQFISEVAGEKELPKIAILRKFCKLELVNH